MAARALTDVPLSPTPMRARRQSGHRPALIAAILAGIAVAACGEAQETSGAADGGAISPPLAITNPLGDITLGDADAPVAVVEYASFTCSHCAAFHALNLPPLKENYIDTGKVFYVFREYPLDPVATAASMLARCVAPESYLQFSDVLFARQQQWAFVPDARAALAEIARQGGIGAAQFEACMTDQTVFDGLREIQRHAQEQLDVQATPTIFVNDRKIDGNLPWPQLEEIITNKLPE